MVNSKRTKLIEGTKFQQYAFNRQTFKLAEVSFIKFTLFRVFTIFASPLQSLQQKFCNEKHSDARARAMAKSHVKARVYINVIEKFRPKMLVYFAS